MSDWLYRSLRRAGRHAEAKALLGTISPGMNAGENDGYYTALRFYQGALTESQALEGAVALTTGWPPWATAWPTSICKRQRRACLRAVPGHRGRAAWNAFGAIAAEAELVRGHVRQQDRPLVYAVGLGIR